MEYLTNQNFDTKVLENDEVTVVYFMTPTCPNCKWQDHIFEATLKEGEQSAAYFKLNAHDYLDVAKSYKVMGVPTLLFFKHGYLVKKKSGVQKQQKIEKIIDSIKDYSPEEARDNQYKSFFQKILGR